MSVRMERLEEWKNGRRTSGRMERLEAGDALTGHADARERRAGNIFRISRISNFRIYRKFEFLVNSNFS